MKAKKEMKFSTYLTLLLCVPIGFYLFFLFLFYPGRVVWEPFVAAAVYTFIMTVFVIICSLSPRVVFALWFLGYLLFLGIFYYLGNDASTCLTEDFCLNTKTVGATPSLLINSALIVIENIVIIFLLVAGLRFATRVLQIYPPARYYTIAGISFFFLILFRLVYMVLEHEANILQNIFSVYLVILGLVGIYVARNVDKLSERVKKIPAAAMLSTIFLLPILVPFPEEQFVEAKLVLTIFAGFAVFIFFFALFHKKQEIGKSIEKKAGSR